MLFLSAALISCSQNEDIITDDVADGTEITTTVSDKDDNHVISHNPDILVPVFPGRVTLVVGHWLTENGNNGGGGGNDEGVSIDPDFTDEIIVGF